MSRDDTLRWLAALQARFSVVLRTPLADQRGTLAPDLTRYPGDACADVLPGPGLTAPERLAVYNRQYWMRLLRTLHEELPLTTRLLGAWELNRIAMCVLHEHPPRGPDLGAVADGFAERLARIDDLTLPREVLVEAATIDDAFRKVFLAPPAPVFDPRRPPHFCAAYRRIDEHWPLIELRGRLLRRSVERAVPLPERLPRPRHYALFRTARGVGQLKLAPAQARLFALLEERPLAEALGQLEAETEGGLRSALPAQTRRWLAQAVRLGLFGEPRPLARQRAAGAP